MTRANRFRTLHEQFCKPDTLLQPDRLLQRAATQWPERTALICGDNSITYAHLYHTASHVTHILRKHGVGTNSHILLMCENSIAFYALYFGIWQSGAVVAPLNTYLHHNELQHIVDDFQPSFIIASEEQKEKLADINHSATVYTYTQLQEEDAPQEEITIPDRNPDAMAAILYTSGTTGYPKGVMLSSRNIITNVVQGIALFDITENERVCASLPLFHSFMQNACVWTPILLGATIIIIPHIRRSTIKTALAQRPTFLPTIPQLYGLLCRLRGISLKYTKLCISGGDALADKIRMAFALRFRRLICNGYGLTETSPFIAINLEDGVEPTNVIGRPAPGMDIDIRDDQNNSLPQGSVGTLWVRGDNVMLGYYNAPEQTDTVIHNGWFNTGDLALQRTDGKLMLCGRAKDLIIHKGRNIYPQEIENILMNHADVTMAGVIAQTHDNEEWPVAFVAAHSRIQDVETMKDELRKLCKENLAPYKVPITYYIRKSLPTTTTGKVDKKELRKELA